MTKVAAVQMVSTPIIKENIATARRLIGDAAGTGAELVLLPEYWPSIGLNDSERLHHAEPFRTDSGFHGGDEPEIRNLADRRYLVPGLN